MDKFLFYILLVLMKLCGILVIQIMIFVGM